MDINLAVICGRLATAPEVRTHDSGARTLRALVTVTTDTPRQRIDVVPVTLWADRVAPDTFDRLTELEQGTRVWVTGSVQRRTFDSAGGRRTSVEVIADQITTLAAEARP